MQMVVLIHEQTGSVAWHLPSRKSWGQSNLYSLLFPLNRMGKKPGFPEVYLNSIA